MRDAGCGMRDAGLPRTVTTNGSLWCRGFEFQAFSSRQLPGEESLRRQAFRDTITDRHIPSSPEC